MLPFTVFLSWVAARHGPVGDCWTEPVDHPNPKRDSDGRRVVSTRWIAVRCGLRQAKVQQWRLHGTVTLDQADRLADGIGVYPGTIWADYETLALAEWEPTLLDLIDYPEEVAA